MSVINSNFVIWQLEVSLSNQSKTINNLKLKNGLSSKYIYVPNSLFHAYPDSSSLA